MKRILLFVIIVGFASLASAGLDVTIGGLTLTTANWDGLPVVSAGSLIIDAEMNSSEVQYQLQVDVTGGLAIVSSGVNFPGAGTFWMFGNTFLGTPTSTSATMTGGTFMPVAIGTPAFDNLVITGTVGTIVLTETFSDLTTQVSTTPEPMTMALLGLGGLFIRHRK